MTFEELLRKNKELEDKLEQGKKAQRQMSIFQNTLISITERIQDINSPIAIIETVNKLLGEVLNLDRVLVFQVNYSTKKILRFCEWSKEEYAQDIKERDSNLFDIYKSPLTQIIKTHTYILSHIGSVNKHFLDNNLDNLLHEKYMIKSILWYPFGFDGNDFYFFSLEQLSNERVWTNEEHVFLDSITNKLNLALLNLRLSNERQALKESEEKVSAIFNNSLNAIIVADDLGNYNFVNMAAATMFGYSEEELRKMNVAQIRTSMPENAEEQYRKYLEKGKEIGEFDFIRPDDTQRIAQYHAVRVKENFNLSILTDITEQKKVEIALRASEQKYKNITENIPGLVLRIELRADGTEKFHYLSKSVEKLFELSYEEAFHNPSLMWQRIHPDDIKPAADALQKSAAELSIWDLKFRLVMPDGRIKWVRAIGTPSKGENGSFFWDTLEIEITELVKAENELILAKEKAEESEQRLKLATNSAELGIWDWDINENVVVWDDRMFELFGHSKKTKEVPFELWLNSLHPDDKEKSLEEVSNALEGKKEFNATFRVIHTDDKVLHIKGDGLTLRDSEGNALRMIGINYDVTEAIIKEVELKKSKEAAERIAMELNESQKVAKLGSWYLNALTNEVTWSDELFKIYGYELGSKVPDYPEFEQLSTPESWERLTKTIANAIETGISYELELEFFRKDRSHGWMWARGEAVLDSNKKVIGIRGVSQDITERKYLELELTEAKEKAEESEKLIKKITENFPNAYVSLIEKDFTIGFTSGQEFINQGINPDDFIGKRIDSIFGEHSTTIIEHYQKTFKGAATGFELLFEGMYLFFKTVPLYGEQNQISKILVVAENITNQKKKEIELYKAKEKAEESDRLKTEFINNMSHEIRTPMNGILGFSNMLNDEDLSKEKRKFFINIIQNSGKQLMRVIDDILEISQLGTKQVKVLEEHICLNDLLLEHFSVFDIKAKENNTPLYLKKGLSDTQSIILTDGTKLNKILSNLLENALKYTHDGFIEIGYQLKDDDMIELYVKDTGIGIKKNMQEKIFDRFSQEEKELSKNVGGLGLGLSIAKENVELLGGNIYLKSKKGKGSTFFITIPYKQPILNKNKGSNDISEEGVKQNIYTVLVAEDEEINYLFIEVFLEKEQDYDIKVLHAKNGKEAVELCQGNNQISLVLMDLKMPLMNGYEAAKKIKELHPNLPLIAQTAYTRVEEQEKALSVGYDDFLSKPIDKNELSQLVNKYLQK